MEELKGLIKGAEAIINKIWLTAEKCEKDGLSREVASREIDLLSRELICISGTIKQVAYEIRKEMVCK